MILGISALLKFSHKRAKQLILIFMSMSRISRGPGRLVKY